MTPLLSDAGHSALRSFIRQPLLCLFDFDGTLAPIAADPACVYLPPPVRTKLSRLKACAAVGIVTGRSLADMRQRLGFAPDYLVGNHGLEGLPGWEQHADRWQRLCEVWSAQLRPVLASIDPGLWLEDKQYSLSVHLREARDPAMAEALLQQKIAQLIPDAQLIPGKHLLSLLPAGAGDKGRAVLALRALTGSARLLYVGDDVTDEAVFRLREPAIFCVRVGPVAPSAAPWSIPDARCIGALLDAVLALLNPRCQTKER